MADQLPESVNQHIETHDIIHHARPVRSHLPSGKPYQWQLRHDESPELVALPQEALAERAAPLDLAIAVERTAALLVVLVRTNGYEGRDPAVITDGLQCGAVADLLGLDIDTLARVLLTMKRRGLVSATDDGGLHIDDMEGLDRLSDGR